MKVTDIQADVMWPSSALLAHLLRWREVAASNIVSQTEVCVFYSATPEKFLEAGYTSNHAIIISFQIPAN
jgi:hypothetical protein